MNAEQSMVKLMKGTVHQYRKCLPGTQILSMSKHIMNEVMCLAEDLNIQVYYQDTDSYTFLKIALASWLLLSKLSTTGTSWATN